MPTAINKTAWLVIEHRDDLISLYVVYGIICGFIAAGPNIISYPNTIYLSGKPRSATKETTPTIGTVVSSSSSANYYYCIWPWPWPGSPFGGPPQTMIQHRNLMIPGNLLHRPEQSFAIPVSPFCSARATETLRANAATTSIVASITVTRRDAIAAVASEAELYASVMGPLI
ncbi:hypothetical protein B296_00017063 [Ensete ventricosum]|uniref:Uncharacterized protein n=1 Tax=Ensete ventricosum TaxID=4639 RepID=A0A427AAD6_ENSVE|nr:hypothetical protein B296_00017063 [Ensete ventricosum]